MYAGFVCLKGNQVMADKANSQGTMDPMEMWKQWNQSTSTMWSNVMGGNKEPVVDPYGLYQAWLKGVEEAQEQLKSGATKLINPEEFWKNWFETTTASWRKAAESGTDPFGLTTRWLELMEEARNKMFAGGNMPTDPFTFYKQWYDATSETWSKVVGDIITTDEFNKASGQFMENYLGFVKTSRRAYEEYFKNLQLPTRSDITRIAEMIVLLEDKVDTIEDAVEDFDDSIGQLATNESVHDLATRMNGVENSLTALPSAIEKINTLTTLPSRLNSVEQTLSTMGTTLEKVNSLTGLSSRLDGVEQTLSTMGNTLEKVNAVTGLESRLSQVESKLDQVLAALTQIATKEQPATAQVKTATPRRAKKNTQPHDM